MMKVVEKIYIPVRTIRLRKEPTQTKECFCTNGKEHPRIYKSLDTLAKYMPEEFYSVYVYELTKIVVNKKEHSHEISLL